MKNKATYITVYILISTILFSAALYIWLAIQKNIYIKELTIKQKLESSSIQNLISNYIERCKKDILEYSRRPVVTEFIKNPTEKNKKLLEFLASNSMKITGNYSQFRLFNLSGQEIFRINYVNQVPVVIHNDELQDKSKREYFQSSKNLNNGEIYISPIDYNKEHGEYVYPLNSTLRLVTPEYVNGKKSAYLVINFNLNFLSRGLNAFEKTSDFDLYIFNENNQVVFHKLPGDISSIIPQNKEFAGNINKILSETRNNNSSDLIYINDYKYGSHKSDEALYITIVESKEKIDAAISGFKNNILLILLPFYFLVIAGGLFVISIIF